jgi:hypothetical protein
LGRSELSTKEMSLLLVALNLVVALLTGFGALEAFIIDGIRGGRLQPFVISLIGIGLSLLFITSGIALLRQWPTVRRLIS